MIGIIAYSPTDVVLCAKRDNFTCTDKEVGVQKQLGVLAILLKVLDPKLHQHIGTAIFSYVGSVHFLIEYFGNATTASSKKYLKNVFGKRFFHCKT